MKIIYASVVSLIAAFLLACTPAQVNTVNTIATDTVNAAEFACIEASPLTTSPEIAVACKVVDTIDKASPGLLSFIDSIIAQREALKSAGFSFDASSAKWSKK
jgi:hypothetical protein